MTNNMYEPQLELICAIVNYGMGSKIIKSAKKCGITGGTITFGNGTVSNKFLSHIGLSDIRKEIVYIVTDASTACNTLKELNAEFKFYKPNHGIAFTTSIGCVYGASIKSCEKTENEKSEDKTMYNLITTIVEKGKAEDVITAATAAGSRGGTVINGRGSGIHETSMLFSMAIEPEKEIVLILSEVEKTDGIVNSIKNELSIEEPGKGIIYVQLVDNAYGLYK